MQPSLLSSLVTWYPKHSICNALSCVVLRYEQRGPDEPNSSLGASATNRTIGVVWVHLPKRIDTPCTIASHAASHFPALPFWCFDPRPAACSTGAASIGDMVSSITASVSPPPLQRCFLHLQACPAWQPLLRTREAKAVFAPRMFPVAPVFEEAIQPHDSSWAPGATWHDAHALFQTILTGIAPHDHLVRLLHTSLKSLTLKAPQVPARAQ